jgi:hypothetical protein
MAQIKLPNGQLKEVPDDATDEEILAYVNGQSQQPAAQPQSIMDSIKNFLSTGVQNVKNAYDMPKTISDIKNVTGGVVHGIPQGLVNAANALPNMLGRPDVAELPKWIPKIGNPDSSAYKFFDNAGQYGLPGLGVGKAMGALGEIPAGYKALGTLAHGGLTGILSEAGDLEDRLKSGAKTAVAEYGLSKVPDAYFGIKDAMSNLKNKVTGHLEVPQKAADIYKQASGGLTQDQLNDAGNRAVKNSYNALDELEQSKYDLMNGDISKNGYGYSPDRSILETKFLPPSDKTAGHLKELLAIGNDPGVSLPKPLRTAIEDYMQPVAGRTSLPDGTKKPIYSAGNDFKTAQNLQRQLGFHGMKYTASDNPAIQQIADIAKDARNSLREDIVNGFINNGDRTLAERYKELSDWHYEHKTPYEEDPVYSKIIYNDKYAPNISEALSRQVGERKLIPIADRSGVKDVGEEKTIPSIHDTVRSHLFTSPDVKRTIFAHQLSPAAERLPDGTVKVNPEKMVSRAFNMNSKLSPTKPQNLDAQLKELAKAPIKFSPAQKTAIKAGLSGAGTVMGAPYAYHYLQNKFSGE